MDQSVKCLACKLGDLNSHPQEPHKKPGTYNPSAWETDSMIPGAHGPRFSKIDELQIQ